MNTNINEAALNAAYLALGRASSPLCKEELRRILIAYEAAKNPPDLPADNAKPHCGDCVWHDNEWRCTMNCYPGIEGVYPIYGY